MILLVTYDLKARRDYSLFYSALQQEGDWWHYLTNTWLLYTGRTPEDVATALRPHMALGDLLLVVEIRDNFHGYLPKDAWDWIRARLDREASGVPPFLRRMIPPPPRNA